MLLLSGSLLYILCCKKYRIITVEKKLLHVTIRVSTFILYQTERTIYFWIQVDSFL